MLEAVGHPVRRLRRSRVRRPDARDVSAGQWRELTRDEVARLRRLVGL